jgi:hypothetical protein
MVGLTGRPSVLISEAWHYTIYTLNKLTLAKPEATTGTL